MNISLLTIKNISRQLVIVIYNVLACFVFHNGSIAQLVEQRTENPCVGSSSLPRATIV